MNKIKDIQDKEKKEDLLKRAKAFGLTEDNTEQDVIDAETKAAKESNDNSSSSNSPEISVGEKDARQLLDEIRSRVKSKDSLTKESVNKMIKDAVEKAHQEDVKARSDSERKGEFSGVDVDPGRQFATKGKVDSRFGYKHFIVGAAPKRAARKYAEEVKDLQDMNDEILITSKVLNVHPKELKMYKEYEEAARNFQTKAMVSTTASSGDEFVPTNFSAQVVDKVRLELKVAALHDRITMPSNPFTVPLEGSDTTAYLATESTGAAVEADRFTESSPGTSNVTFTAKKLAARTVFSDEINEDSIVNILDFVRKKIALALADGIETATINGDTSGTHQDADVTSSADARKAWNGYRKLTSAGAKTDAGGDALDAVDMRNARKAMGKYGINPRDLAWVVGVNTYHQMLSESDANGFNDFRTLDKLGPNAQILTGQMGAFDSIPVIVSEHVRENLGASGVYDGTNVGETAIHLVNRSRFWYGDRRLVTLKTFEDIQTDQIVMVIKQRLDFQPVESSSNALVATVIDILVN